MTFSTNELKEKVEAYLIHSYNDIGGSTQNAIHAFIKYLEDHVVKPVEAEVKQEVVGTQPAPVVKAEETPKK